MAELEFERRLERLFNEPPALSGEGAFAALVEQKLNRGWTLRRGIIGAAGLVGGVVGASQLIMSNFIEQVETASKGSTRLIEMGMSQWAPRLEMLSALPAGSSVVWIAGGMAVLAIGFVVTRVLEEF
ncbi:MAG: hypothetical protein V4820_10990 [Pseudomonadota bacterium]|uniref:hypothetical protein n=1 Tax=Phenylobacterium sp. TaxID=1871053 RepID=UPI00271F3043|nr:hypothetical protein [Phenylobacterium sp.]MDO9430565.1 hypothetical protein [Phenylobacterium sp.]